jgi:hypothetical protein
MWLLSHSRSPGFTLRFAISENRVLVAPRISETNIADARRSALTNRELGPAFALHTQISMHAPNKGARHGHMLSDERFVSLARGCCVLGLVLRSPWSHSENFHLLCNPLPEPVHKLIPRTLVLADEEISHVHIVAVFIHRPVNGDVRLLPFQQLFRRAP